MIIRPYGDVVLLYAEESLLLQIATLIEKTDWLSIRLVWSRNPVVIARSLADAVVAIVDATDYPGQAVATLEHCLTRLPHERVAVYTERTHQGLEVFTRVRGVQLLLGPMSQAEWDGLLGAFKRARLSLQEHEPQSQVGT